MFKDNGMIRNNKMIIGMIMIKIEVLPVELVQGITFGLFFPTLVSVSAKIAPPGVMTIIIVFIMIALITMTMIMLMAR